MNNIQIQRTVRVPDKVRLARYAKSPDLGPSVLFFSGGTALRELSRELVHYTHNSIHLITPFDSGGSSAELRAEFNMLAVGDVRNRLMALADRSMKGNPEIFELFAYRFPKDAQQAELLQELDRMIRGIHPLVSTVPDPMRKLVRSHLRFFKDMMTPTFRLQGASIGNLILAGGYFNHNNHIDPVIYLFSKLVEVRGTVRPTVSKDYQLCAELEDGSIIIGQHNITGKEVAPLHSPIARVFLSENQQSCDPVRPVIRKKVETLVQSAELICYPMGSFYSSIIANLLPAGVGKAVSQNGCPKVYIPNSAPDPEQVGMTLFSSVRNLLQYLQEGCGEEPVPRETLLNFILIDSKRGQYPAPLELNKITRFGVEVIDTDLVSDESSPNLDPNKVLEVLLSLT